MYYLGLGVVAMCCWKCLGSCVNLGNCVTSFHNEITPKQQNMTCAPRELVTTMHPVIEIHPRLRKIPSRSCCSMFILPSTNPLRPGHN
mmetsp:Transcript_14230/g.30322  ORF Transcript_14230/g.30322 Transcript_14230/m.30322 type:complete len:88 (-) Transcript_14230:124-387(-)